MRDDRQSGRGRRAQALLTGVAVLVLCAALAAGALAASTNFAPLATSPEATGDGPTFAAAADLDGDTDRDLVVTNSNSDTVTILKNNGSGDFDPFGSSPKAVGDGPEAVAAGDLDGDGDQDLAIMNANADDVTILKNGGSGFFTEPASSPEPVGDFPFGLALADVDGDGDLDLAVANQFDSNVTILKNNGGGHFFEPGSSPEAAGISPISVAAADLDGDGDRDLAVADGSGGSVTILKNSGGGNYFQPASSPEAAGLSPRFVVATDLDGDGDRDLAVVNSGSVNVTILRNNGSANFFEISSSPKPVGGSPTGAVAADFEGDGDQDLAVSNAGSGDVTILRNNGSGNLTEPATSPEPVGTGPNAIIAARLAGDGDIDLATPNFGSDNITILGNQ
jgi:hypothetical protein